MIGTAECGLCKKTFDDPDVVELDNLAQKAAYQNDVKVCSSCMREKLEKLQNQIEESRPRGPSTIKGRKGGTMAKIKHLGGESYIMEGDCFEEREFDFADLHKKKWLWWSDEDNMFDSINFWDGWEVEGGTLPDILSACFPCETVRTPTIKKYGCFSRFGGYYRMAGPRGLTYTMADCDKCPLQWPLGLKCKTDAEEPLRKTPVHEYMGLDQRFFYYKDNALYQEAQETAIEIANLEWKGPRIFKLDVKLYTKQNEKE